MKKLKNILQSKTLYIILTVFIILFVVVKTKIIKYETLLSNEALYTGKVVQLSISQDQVSFIIKGKEKLLCNYYVENPHEYNNLLGKKVTVYGSTKDASKNTIPNTFNYKNYLYNNYIYKIMNVTSIDILKKENIFYKIRNNINDKINNYDGNINTYLNLFLLGNKANLNNDTYEDYKGNGIWHLFAVSGMHIDLIVLALGYLLKRIKYNNIIICIIVFYFLFLTDFAPSVLRSGIFYYLKSILSILKIKLDNKQILFLDALIILLINPFTIYNAGFQYSFLITYSIMLESNKLTGNYIIKIFKISLLSFVVSLPITANMNYEINLMSILLNIIYVPFITYIVFPISILTFISNIFSPIFQGLIFILEQSNIIFTKLSINITIAKMPIITILIYYLVLYLFHRFRKRIYLFVLVVLMLTNNSLLKINRNLYIYYWDVGQGDSAAIISPFGKDVVVIDTGGEINSNYKKSSNYIKFFKSKGIKKIDNLILTHGDYDHMGEAINLVENFKVEKVIFNCGEFNGLEKDLIKVLDKKKIPYYSCIKELNIDNQKLYFLNNRDYGNENDNSSVIYTELNNHKFLFMGDAGVEVEQDLLEKYNLKDVDVLKVGHHGSKTSSSKNFIDEINHKFSIISVGKNNRYGHPNTEVLDNLEDSKIYRTDKDGSIMFKIKNNKLKIKTCSP